MSAALSPYSTFSNSPLWISDVNGDVGDTLSYNNGNAETSQDLMSIVSENFRKYVVLNSNGEVSISPDFKKLSSGEQSKILDSDQGFNLIYTEVNSDKNFYFSTTPRIRYYKTDINGVILKDANGDNQLIDVNLNDFYKPGDKLDNVPLATGDIPLNFTFKNLSNTYRGDEVKNGYGEKPFRQYKKPGTNYTRTFDGEVYIAPGTFYGQSLAGGRIPIQIPRSSVVFHEMRENLLRVLGSKYIPAHDQSSLDALKNVGGQLGAGFNPGNDFMFFIFGTISLPKF